MRYAAAVAPRMKDVAEHAGVSIKTVSNVVNGYPFVTLSTRERVEAAIAELGYRPNLTARSLRGGRSGVIALAIPDLASPYFAEIARDVVHVAASRRWTVLVEQTDGLRGRELEVLQGIRDNLADGVIFSPLALGTDELREARPQVPMVCIGERVTAGVMDHVAIDNVAAAREATGLLIASGRRRIAAIGEQTGTSAATARLRLQGYRDALRAAGLTVDPALVLPAVSWHRLDGQAAGEQLARLSEPPDAIFCCNDLLAIGAIHGLALHGVRVPDDVAVVGIDDIEEGHFVRPTLSTIAPDKEAIARHSVELLLQRLTGDSHDAPGAEITVPFTLVRRQSA